MPPPDEHPVDRAVREHLEREAAKVDAPAMLAKVRANLPAPIRVHDPGPTRRAWLRGTAIGTGGAIAAGVGIYVVLGGTGPVEPKMLSASEWIRAAKTAHETEKTDRCYDVVADWDVTPFQKRFPFRPIAKRAKLWTRGDQFYVEATFADGFPVKWGQERTGRVWILPRPDRVLVYEPDDLAEPLARFCEMMSLRLVSTLADLLEKYDLKRETAGPDEPIRIEANPRGNPNSPLPRLSNVMIELDPKTKIVRKAVLTRAMNGETIGSIEFALLETAALDEKKYEYRTHAAANHQVIDGPRPPLVPPAQPLPRFDPRNDARARFRDDWLKGWQHRGGPKG